jgi:hypothetical protein
MPKEQSIAIAKASKRWTITSYTVEPGPVDPMTGTVFIDVRIETVADGSAVDGERVRHTVSGPAVQALLVDTAARLKAYLTAGQAGPIAYYLGTRDALYALLQRDGVIPQDAV